MFIQTPAAYPQDQQRDKLKMVIEAACQARRPCQDMRIKWTLTNPARAAMVLRSHEEQQPPPKPRRRVVEFTATLSGSRSRIDQIDSVYRSGDIGKPPDAVKNSISVFDGNTNRSFNQIQGDEVKQGIIVSDNVNDSILRASLWEMGFNLCAPGVAEDRNLTLKETQDPNIYIIDYLSPKTRWIDRMTIDTGKQCQVIKFENIKRDGSYDYVIDYTYKKHPNGTWFLDSWEKRRYSIRDKNGNPGVEAAAKVEDVEFDIQVPEETLKLKYPKGTRISDSQTDQTYIVE